MSTSPLTTADAQVQTSASADQATVQASLASPRAAPQEGPAWEEIAAEAYALYLADGCREGNDLQHWLEAERNLEQRRARPDSTR
jgi:hypothetical protein